MATAPHDLFHSPKSRLKRANGHISRLHSRIEAFFNRNPYRKIIDIDVDGITRIHKFKFTRQLPGSCTHSAAEAIEALRSTLDQAGFAAAVASGKLQPKKTQFPIGDDFSGLENVIGRKVSKDLPDEILALFRSFNPYKGGNNATDAHNAKQCAGVTSFAPGHAADRRAKRSRRESMAHITLTGQITGRAKVVRSPGTELNHKSRSPRLVSCASSPI